MCTLVKAQQKFYYLLEGEMGKDYTHIISDYHGFEIETFNVFGESSTSLFSLLPNFKSKKVKWKKIHIDTLKDKVYSKKDLSTVFFQSYHNYFKIKNKKLEYNDMGMKISHVFLIVKKNDGYYTNISDGYLEFFKVEKNYGNEVANYINTIYSDRNYIFELNLLSPTLRISEFEANCQKIYHKFSNNHPTKGSPFVTYHQNCMLRNADTTIMGQKAYRFWTYGARSMDGIDQKRGIDRLTYIPSMGVVAGSYTFYFLNPLDSRSYGDERYAKTEESNWQKWLSEDYINDVQSTPILINGKKVNEL